MYPRPHIIIVFFTHSHVTIPNRGGNKVLNDFMFQAKSYCCALLLDEKTLNVLLTTAVAAVFFFLFCFRLDEKTLEKKATMEAITF